MPGQKFDKTAQGIAKPFFNLTSGAHNKIMCTLVSHNCSKNNQTSFVPVRDSLETT